MSGSSFNVGNWSGSAYTNDQTGAFSHCVAQSPYLNDTLLLTSFDKDQVWSIGFVNPNWSLPPRTNVAVFLKFDTSPWKEYRAFAYDKSFLTLDMGINGLGFADLFKKSHLMQMRFDNFAYQFDLKDTSKVLNKLSSCVFHYAPPATSQDTQVSAADKTAPQTATDKNTAPETPNTTSATSDSGNDKTKPPSISTGTGIIISQDGHILTNNHVIEKCSTIGYIREGDFMEFTRPLRYDPSNDLVVLKSEKHYSPSEIGAFRNGDSLKAGENIVSYGFPLTGTLSQSGNIVSGNISSLAGIGDDARFYQITAPIQPGNSGGPLLDLSGNIVGIVNHQLDAMKMLKDSGSIPQNVNFAIKSNVARNFLDTHGIEYQLNDAEQQLSLVEIAQKAKRFTVNIICSSQ